MGIYEQIQAEHANFDPHGLKNPHTPTTSHVNAPYVHQEFPKVVYKGEDTLTVQNKAEYDKAKTEGFTDTLVVPPAPVVPSAAPVAPIVPKPV